MENSMKWLVYVLVVAAALGGGYLYLKVQPPGAETQNASVALASFTNAEGKPWSIPTGGYEFTVSGDRSFTPSFIWGDIRPMDVQPGDTQKMKIIVSDTTPVKSVVAEFETDTKKWTVPLRLVETSASLPSEIAAKVARYSVDENNRLVINDNPEELARAESAFIASAGAEGPMQYTFEGEWVVEDTHRNTYHTIFVAENDEGKKNTLVMAWSDPCFFWGGQPKIGCSVSSGADGLDNSNITIPASTNINVSGGEFVFNPGNSITLSAGSSFTMGGGRIFQSYLYHGPDADGDLVPASVAYSTSSAGTGTRRAYLSYGSEVDTGYKAPVSAVSTGISLVPFEKAYSFIDEFIGKVFAVGPCPGHPSCPGTLGPPPWTNPTSAITEDGTTASAATPGSSAEYLRVYNFSASLPSTGTSTPMASIEVKVRARVDSGLAKIAVFVGNFSPDQQVGSELTLTNTTLSDYTFGGPGELYTTFSGDIINNSNFSIYLQAYDATGSVYVDSVRLRAYYKMGPGSGDLYDNVASNKGLGYGIVTGSNNGSTCASAGGTLASIGGQDAVCRFGATIPGGWTAYGSWSQTNSAFCDGGASLPFPPFASIPTAGAACAQNSCTTGGHTWANTTRETCTYYELPDTLCQTPITCNSTYVYRGAY